MLGNASRTPWLDVPFVQQVKAGCGSAAVAMVVEYWARQVKGLDSAASDAERIDKLLPASDPKGIKGAALRAYLQEHGFNGYIFTGEQSDLQHHLEKGRPVIVCIAPKGLGAPLHYVVIVGMESADVWMNDPARGKLFHEDLPRFLAEWKDTGNWALLAVPRTVR
ncbi:MAG: peptidase family [Bryobacterales bacterium]|nr:peptidase family [Bryobacterales bacterium]